jgi:hypothetical protein
LLVDPVRHAAVLWPAASFKGLNAMFWFWYATTTDGMPVFAVAGAFDVAVVSLMIVLVRRAGNAAGQQSPVDGWSTFERRWRDTLVDTIAPRGPGAGTRATFWQEVGEWAPRSARRGMRLAVWVLTLSPVLYVGRPVVFGTLPGPQRERCIEHAARSRSALVRELLGVVRLMACVELFDDSTTRREAGRQ